jgi:hypothetical protein
MIQFYFKYGFLVVRHAYLSDFLFLKLKKYVMCADLKHSGYTKFVMLS